MIMIAVCVILAFQFFAIIDSHIFILRHGEIGHVNCTSGEYPGRIDIHDVNISSTLCNGSLVEVESQISIQCQNMTECDLDIKDIIQCSGNETLDFLVEIVYECAIDGGWSEWSVFSACSLTCGGGTSWRSRKCNTPVPNMYGQNCSGQDVEEKTCNTNNCSNPHILTYNEGDMAHLTCSEAFNETIIISSIQYYQGNCNHTDLFGIQNICDHRNTCSFNVSNSNVGSSCGRGGKASLDLTYNCKRDGGWSNWSNFGSCSAPCGGGLQTRYRECTNPTPNEIGNDCTGENSTQDICSIKNCVYDSDSCINETITWTCKGGYINITKAIWRTSSGKTCGDEQAYDAIPVPEQIQKMCFNRSTCTFRIEEATFNVSCSKFGSICTQLEYRYTCHKAYWEAWSEWSECSRSCGNGVRSRTRSCSGQTTTVDGHSVGCEGNSVDSTNCSADVCPCAPPLFQPDTTYVEIPDHTAVDSLIVSLPLLELDFSNYWQYLQFDYGNEYFYIDTRLRSLNLKTAFPHIQGLRNSTHEYILTVVDSCKNKISSRISVVSYNAPPVVTGLKDVIQVDLSVLGNSSFLTSFQVTDPSEDDVACTIKETIPSTATVFINKSENDVVLHLSENTSLAIDTFSQILIHIICNDGTTVVENQVIIMFITGEQFKSNSSDATIIVVLSVIAILLIIVVVVGVRYYLKRKRKLMSVEKLTNYIVEHKLSSDDENELGEINLVSPDKEPEEHQYTKLSKPYDKNNSNSASFKLGASKGEYVDAWR